MIRRCVRFGVVGLGVALVCTACSGGCASLQTLFGGSSPPPSSAEALAGTYDVTALERAEEGCLRDDPSGGSEGHVVRIRRLGAKEEAGGASEQETSVDDGSGGASSSEPGLGVEICRSERCSELVWKGTLERNADSEWSYERGFVSVLEGPPFARRCRLTARRARLRPTDSGVRFEWTERSGDAVLEGDLECEERLAVGRGDALPCRSQLVVDAE